MPKQLYSLEDLRLNKIQPEALLAPTDDTLGKIRTGAQVHPHLCASELLHCVSGAVLHISLGAAWLHCLAAHVITDRAPPSLPAPSQCWQSQQATVPPPQT